LRALLSRREWVYLLSLLVPFAVYNLALKADSIVPRLGDLGLARVLTLMRSDVFFNLGYTSFWIGLFAAARRGPLRWVVIFLFHITTVLVGIVRASSHQYFKETGTTLDYDIVALWGPRFDEIKPMIRLPRRTWMLLATTFFYATLGPWILARAVGWWRGWPESSSSETPQRISLLAPLGLFLQALGFGSLSLLVGSVPAGASKSFSRDPFVNLVVTGVKEAITEKDASKADSIGEHPAAHASLAETPRTQKRNVVLIHLESTRAQSVTPYNKELETTPFLNELSKSSLLVERAYTTIPNTLKAIVSVNCGIEPDLRPATEAKPGGIPAQGLANLLKEQDYSTVFFQSSTEKFEKFRNLAKNLGYDEYYPLEHLDEEYKEGFEWANYFGYEDDVMLKPSKEWLKGNKDRPFVVKYLTGTGHHDYLPPKRYGLETFSDDDKLNRYLNCLRYQDFFVRNLIEQYKELGLYEDTIFVIYGDHGEGFGEHGRYVHENNPYEESLKIPLVIHDPKRFQDGERVKGLSNHMDILPTVLDLLGFELKNGEYPGYSLLRLLPEDRTLMLSCFNKDKCLVSIKGSKKYIHHYGNEPDELFDLSKDPLERKNLADERPEEVSKRREEILAWHSAKGWYHTK
jgi:lipoteichoic acid synthase